MSALRVNSGTGTHSAIPPKSGIVYRLSNGEQLADSRHHAILAEFVKRKPTVVRFGVKSKLYGFFPFERLMRRASLARAPGYFTRNSSGLIPPCRLKNFTKFVGSLKPMEIAIACTELLV
jgi:hypothetical protein